LRGTARSTAPRCTRGQATRPTTAATSAAGRASRSAVARWFSRTARCLRLPAAASGCAAAAPRRPDGSGVLDAELRVGLAAVREQHEVEDQEPRHEREAVSGEVEALHERVVRGAVQAKRGGLAIPEVACLS